MNDSGWFNQKIKVSFVSDQTSGGGTKNGSSTGNNTSLINNVAATKPTDPRRIKPMQQQQAVLSPIKSAMIKNGMTPKRSAKIKKIPRAIHFSAGSSADFSSSPNKSKTLSLSPQKSPSPNQRNGVAPMMSPQIPVHPPIAPVNSYFNPHQFTTFIPRIVNAPNPAILQNPPVILPTFEALTQQYQQMMFVYLYFFHLFFIFIFLIFSYTDLRDSQCPYNRRKRAKKVKKVTQKRMKMSQM